MTILSDPMQAIRGIPWIKYEANFGNRAVAYTIQNK